MFSGGKIETTGAPAAIVSPGCASTSATRPPTGAVTVRCSSRHSAIPRLGKGRFRVLCLGFRRPVVRPSLIDGLRCGVSGLQQRFVALEVRPRPFEGRTGVGQVGFGLCDLCRLHRRFEIGQLLLGLSELARRLVTGCAFVRVVLRKQRSTLGDLITAGDGNRGQQPLLDWRHLNVVGFGIALPCRRPGVALL